MSLEWWKWTVKLYFAKFLINLAIVLYKISQAVRIRANKIAADYEKYYLKEVNMNEKI